MLWIILIVPVWLALAWFGVRVATFEDHYYWDKKTTLGQWISRTIVSLFVAPFFFFFYIVDSKTESRRRAFFLAEKPTPHEALNTLWIRTVFGKLYGFKE